MAGDGFELRTDVAVDFITRFSEPPWMAIAIQPTQEKGQRPHVRIKVSSLTEEIEQFITQWNGVWNLYFAPNRASPDITTSPTKDQMVAMRAWHCDLDVPKDGTPTPEVIEALQRRIDSFVPPPPIVVFSGGGLQCFWRWDKEQPADLYADKAEAGNKSILRQVGGDGSCYNCNRLMRLPGTANMLNAAKIARGRKPAMAYIIRADFEPRWSFERDAMPVIPEIPAEDIEPMEEDVEHGSPDVHSVDNLPMKLKKAIKSGDAAPYGGDRSRLVWYITCALVRLGWPDELIEQILTSEYACAAHVHDQSNPHTYAKNQVRKARDEVAKDWQRNEKGIIIPSTANTKRALADLGVRFGYNEFEDKSYINGSGPMRIFADHDVLALRFEIEEKYGFQPGREAFFDLTNVLSHERTFNPLVSWLARAQEKWDGVERIGSKDTPSWLTTYGGAEDSPYTRAVGRLTLIAAVRRAREPGCKHDEILVLVSKEQGTNKSSTLAALAVRPEWFTDSFPLHVTDSRKVIEHLAGKWIVECGELAGIRHAQVEEVKSLLSRQVDNGRTVWGRIPRDFPRRCIFFGSTNDTEFLRDTQNRRWWPVTITLFDIDRVRADVEQIWAEAATYEAQGEDITLPKELWAEAAKVQDRHKIDDPWTDRIREAMGDLEGKITQLELFEILRPLRPQQLQTDAARLGSVMRELGWIRRQRRFYGSNPKWCYTKGEHEQVLYVTYDSQNGNAVVAVAPDADTYETGAAARASAEPPPF